VERHFPIDLFLLSDRVIYLTLGYLGLNFGVKS
jgi:hypothetical protein